MSKQNLEDSARLVSALFALLFSAAAVFQLNDPDPIRWIAAYASAAGLAGVAALGRARFGPAALLAAGFALWTATLLPSLLDAERAAFTSFRMHASSHEESREAVGLLLCAAYAAWLAKRCRRSVRLSSP